MIRMRAIFCNFFRVRLRISYGYLVRTKSGGAEDFCGRTMVGKGLVKKNKRFCGHCNGEIGGSSCESIG